MQTFHTALEPFESLIEDPATYGEPDEIEQASGELLLAAEEATAAAPSILRDDWEALRTTLEAIHAERAAAGWDPRSAEFESAGQDVEWPPLDQIYRDAEERCNVVIDT